DGRPVKGFACESVGIVKGDGKCAAIAAASILAKVARDRIMLEFDKQWPQYGFAQHKGYGTPQHLDALTIHGPCPIHLSSFRHISDWDGLFAVDSLPSG